MKKPPYCITSDLHCHSWSQFVTTNSDGVNSRLQIILDELIRAKDVAVAKGAKTMIVAGDLFHVRGSVKPSVINPTLAAFKEVCNELDVYAIAGNHDLEGRDATDLGNAMTALGTIKNFHPVTTPTFVKTGGHNLMLFPWFFSLDELRAEMKKSADTNTDAIIHAPVNGVIKGLPNTGLEADELAAMGYKHVYAGHYHNYVDFKNGVYSVGATTHQTWNDVDSKAGFLMAYDDGPMRHPSMSPLFVDIDNPYTVDKDRVSGNYCRIKLIDVTEEEIKDVREYLQSSGARGVTISVVKKTVTRRKSVTKTGITIEEAVADYVREEFDDDKNVQKLAQEILAEARS